MSDKLTLGYWGIQGLGQVPRYLAEYCELPYEDKQYVPPTGAEDWGKDKESLGLDFPNLPYIVDGKTKVTESSALWRYIPVKAKKTELLGKDDMDGVYIQVWVGVVGDVIQSFVKACFTPKDAFEKVKAAELEKIRAKLALLSKNLGEKEWCIGYLTIADFQLAYILDWLKKFECGILKDYKNLCALTTRFFEIPQIKKYVESGRVPKAFLPPQYASWSGLEACNKITIGYWGIQGLGQLPRYLAEYCELPYHDKQYTDPTEWGKDKESVGFDFPNLPYIIDGDVKLSESSALMRYIPVKANKTELLGKDDWDGVQIQTHLGVVGDIAKSFMKACFSPKDAFEKVKAEELKNTIIPKLALISKNLGEKEWSIGYLTIADFHLVYMLDWLQKFQADILKDTKNLAALHERFFNIPQIKKYVESGRRPVPFLPPQFAAWSGI